MALDVDAALTRIAGAQHSVFTLAQAAAAGVQHREIDVRVRAGVLERPFRSVYRFAAAPLTWHARLLCAVWAGGPRGVASHRSAAALWGLAGGRRDTVEITCPRWRRAKHDGLIVHECNLWRPGDLTVVDAIPVTSPELTLMQLGAVCSPNTVEMAYERARDQQLVTWESCDGLVARYARQGRNGVGVLRSVLARRDPLQVPTQSEMETLLLQLIRRHGLPEPVTQHEVYDATGRFLGRVDLAWPAARLAVEYQSLAHHSTELERAADRRRLHHLRMAAWTVVEVMPVDVRERWADVIDAIRLPLARAGLLPDRFGAVSLRGR
jgi:very-short-patch-repair endonuclease/predicted transcriptional regulator of viral defense system